MNDQRLRACRFRQVCPAARLRASTEISGSVHGPMGRPLRTLDPAAGHSELITSVPAPERWALERVAQDADWADGAVALVRGDALEVELPADCSDGVLVSDFREHLEGHDQIDGLRSLLPRAMSPGGLTCAIGPKFRYCARRYSDDAHQSLAHTHVAVAEHPFAAGFTVLHVQPRLAHHSFRRLLPSSEWLLRRYLGSRRLWWFGGRQLLPFGRKDEAASTEAVG